jgi:peptide/nickel transport system permease protein
LKETISRLTKFRLGFIGFFIILLFGIIAIGAPIIAAYKENEQSYDILQPPATNHPLGTDSLGRDVLSRIIYGTRISMAFGIGAAVISLLIGLVLGAVSGYFAGLVDDILSRLFEIVLMIPSFFLIILAVALYGTNVQTSMIIVALTIWPSNARITRAQVLTLKTRAYVQASVVEGASHTRVLFKHILPNGLQPVIANSALQMANSVLMEASLSFLGLGDPDHVSWGVILYDALRNFNSWWLATAGMALMILVLGFNLAADGITYLLSPRLEAVKEP